MNDIEATKETGFKVHKLPTQLREQRQFIENQEGERCKKLLGLGALGSKYYQ